MRNAKHRTGLIFLFSKYILSACYVPGTAASAKEIQMILFIMEHTAGGNSQKVHGM